MDIQWFRRLNIVSSVLGSIMALVTVCPRSLDPIYLVTYCIKWVKTSWTYGMRKN